MCIWIHNTVYKRYSWQQVDLCPPSPIPAVPVLYKRYLYGTKHQVCRAGSFSTLPPLALPFPYKRHNQHHMQSWILTLPPVLSVPFLYKRYSQHHMQSWVLFLRSVLVVRYLSSTRGGTAFSRYVQLGPPPSYSSFLAVPILCKRHASIWRAQSQFFLSYSHRRHTTNSLHLLLLILSTAPLFP